ncbi:MAG: alpha/beta hydrolase [Oscillospiraceae bacterium]
MAINKYMLAALKALSYPDLDLQHNYALMRRMELLAHPTPPKTFYKSWNHLVRRADHEIPVRIFVPDDGPLGRPVLLFFHGGGWVTGNIDSYNGVCAWLSRATGCLVASVDYRLAPEHPFPAGLLDCYEVARELFAKSSLLCVKPEEIALIGDSAGGNLAAAVSLMARDTGDFQPRRQILIYPSTWWDHSDSSPFESIRTNGAGYLLTTKRVQDYMALYQSCPADAQNPYLAPLLAESLAGQPDTLLITAQYDPLRDEGEAYGERLMREGNFVELHRIPDALHGFFSLPPRFSQVSRCHRIINEFLLRGNRL